MKTEARSGSRLSPALFRCTVATGVLAILSFLATGLAGWVSHLAFGIGILLLAWGRAPFGYDRLSSGLCLVILVLKVRFLWQGQAGILVLSGFTSGILAMQWFQMGSFAAVRRALLLASMVVLAVAAMSVNFLFPLTLFPFVILFLATLSSLARCEMAGCAVCRGEGRACPTERFHTRPSLALTYVRGGLLMGILWAGFFYLLPRPDVLGIAAGATKQRLMGFSQTLRLGEIGVLQDNPLVVMRVKPEVGGRISPQLFRHLKEIHLRGCAFVSYERGSWSRPPWRKWTLNLRRSAGQLNLARGPEDARPQVGFEILLEAVDPPLVFVPDQAVQLRCSLPLLLGEPDGTISFFFRRSGIEIYQAQAKLGRPALVEGAPPSEDLAEDVGPYLEIGDSSLYIGEIAAEVASGVTTTLGKVETVSRFLQKTCTYSLVETNAEFRDPVSHFLMNSKAGSCEHFASAMVLMLRYLGVPARPVNGYLLGEWNEFGRFFTVRQRDSHTWVEVFFPQAGWVSFDPTPAAPPEPAGYFADWERVSAIWAQLEGIWFNYVYRFDRNLQSQGFRRLATALGGMTDHLLGLPEPIWHVLTLGSTLVTLLAGAGIFLYLKRKPVPPPPGWVPEWYREGMAWCHAKRHPWETPREFHGRLAREGLLPPGTGDLLAALADQVDEAAFGRNPEGAARQGRELLATLRARLSPREGGGSGGEE